MRRRAVPLAFALFLAVSCSDGDDPTLAGDDTTTSAPATTSTAAPVGAGEARVELLDAGEEPRAAVRLTPAAGTEQLMTLRQEQHFEIDAQGQHQTVDAPPTEIDLRYAVTAVEGGRISAQLEYASPRVAESAGADPATVAQMREMLAGFEGATAGLTFDERGRLLDFEPPAIDIAGPAGPFVEQLLAGMGDQVAALSMPFPDEPIGIGGRWRVTTAATVGGLPMEIVTELRVTELAGGVVAADLEQVFTLVPGPAEIAGTPVQVEGGRLTSTGTARWRLDAVAPAVSQMIDGRSTIAVGEPARRVRVEQVQRQTIEIFER